MSAADLDLITHAIPRHPTRKPKTSSTTFDLRSDLHKVNKKRRSSGVAVNEDNERNAFQANSTPPIKRTCRRRSSDCLDPEDVLKPDVERWNERGSEKLLRNKTVRPSQWTVDAVLPVVVVDGDVSGTGDMPTLTADGWFAPDRAEEAAFTRQGVDPAKYFKVMDSAGTRYACSLCGVVYPGLHELDSHWLQNHERAVANWATFGKNFPSHTAFLRIRPILEAHQASLVSHFIDSLKDERTWFSENISRGSLAAACTWNFFGGAYTFSPEMLLNKVDWSLREFRPPSAPVNPLDLSKNCLPLEPSNHVLDLSTNMKVEPLDLTFCTSNGNGGTASAVIANEEPVEGRKDGVVINMTNSSEMKDTPCIAIEPDVVSDVSLTSEPCLAPSTTLRSLVLNKEHEEENPLLPGSKSTETKDLSPGQGDSCKETVSTSTEDNPQEPKIKGTSDKSRPYACPVCPSTYKRKWMLEKHLKKFHNSFWRLHLSTDSPSTSEMSVFLKESNIPRPASFLSALDPPSAEKPFECTCGYASKWKGNLAKHMHKCRTLRVASTSGEKSKRKVLRSSDINSEEGAVTPIAAISTLTEETLNLSTAMESLALPGVTTTEFKCEWCTLTFLHLTSLYRHANSAHALQLYKQKMEEALDFIPSFPLQSDASIPSCQQTPQIEGSRASTSISNLTCDELRDMKETEAVAPESLKQQQQHHHHQQQTQLQQDQQPNPPEIRRSLRCGDKPESQASPRQPSQGHDEGPALAGMLPSLTLSVSPRRRRRRRGRVVRSQRRVCRSLGSGNAVDPEDQQCRWSTEPALTRVPKYKCAGCDFGTDQRSAIFQHRCGHALGRTTRPVETVVTAKINPHGEIAAGSGNTTTSHEKTAGETAHLGEVTGKSTSLGEIVGMASLPGQIVDFKMTSNPGETASAGEH